MHHRQQQQQQQQQSLSSLTKQQQQQPRLVPTRKSSFTLPRSSSIASPALNQTGATKPAATQRTSKTHQRLVELPSDPQTRPLPTEGSKDDATHGYETDAGVRMYEHKSVAERMTKADRRRAGYRRITAYWLADGLRMKLLANFLKREHNVVPRSFDEALYVMYHLPLLPGYGPAAKVRSSVPAPSHTRRLSRMSEAEEDGYTGSYFIPGRSPEEGFSRDGYIASLGNSPSVDRRMGEQPSRNPEDGEIEGGSRERGLLIMETPETPVPAQDRVFAPPTAPMSEPRTSIAAGDDAAEIVFFAYGVAVFFGFEEVQERNILEDIHGAGTLKGSRVESEWEVEECHFAYDPTIAYPRIYNDFFTFKSPSHLLTLSLSHALAQSTLLGHYESQAHAILQHPRTQALPRTLARTGKLALSRRDAMRLTGKLFALRRDVVLGRNVLDVPGIFWEEASLHALYEAGRAYFEIGERVEALNERISGANNLLDAIHEHLNNNAMERITWIIIGLIVVAILVELGEIIARLTVHSTIRGSRETKMAFSTAASAAGSVFFGNVKGN
ncbi:hypothetical protein B0F90DRAFT_1938044 [Multifurca ochricompacta]|uniref:DUF155 domain-containing protein n=1 Tax=Multifurca ochricompacta TaxID=376703 RepID=A0AAD4QMF1_9AGAM|nr:hypothetical protein B0F90DRAFT_1938044 [Multifurca ochricompacta]